jgi:regulator of protease activity HflC (stomatin/prohibitin superfamily)
MESAFAWIGKFAEFIGDFFPRLKIVRMTHRGVKFIRGKRLKIVDPGLTVYWPLVTDYFDYPAVRQGEELREQTLVTTDDRSIVVGGMLIHEIADMATLMGETYSPMQTIKDIALTAVHDVCCRMSLPELKNEQRRGTLDTKLKNEAQRALDTYGVKVLKLMLTDLSPCRVIRLVQTNSKQGD